MAETKDQGQSKAARPPGRFRRGWEMGKRSWAVVNNDRSLLVFPMVSMVFGLLVAVIFFAPGLALAAVTNSAWWLLPFVIVGGFMATFVAQFFAVALAACATDALEGHDTTFRQGFTAARSHTGVIFKWSLVTFTVGAILSAIQSLASDSGDAGTAVVGTLASALAGFAWAVASFFVIPIIALEGIGPRDALKRSAGLVRQRWGEGVSGNAAIGIAVFVIVFLPAILLIAGGVFLLGSAEALGILLIAVGLVVMTIGAWFNFTVTSVFRVALYRYATEGKVIGDFTEADMADAFTQRRARHARA